MANIVFIGYHYNNGPYSFTNNNGQKVEGTTDKYKLYFTVPIECEPNTQEMNGDMCFSYDVQKANIDNVVEGGAAALSKHIGSACEFHRNINGRIKLIKWVK
jgi:hypothetical protein